MTVACGCILAVSAFLLITASPLLSAGFPGLPALPLGILIAWSGAVALPLCIYTAPARLHPPQTGLDRIMAWLMWALLAAAIAWAPVSFWLSGSLSFEFRENVGFRGSEAALFVFFYYSMAVVVIPVLVGLAYGILAFFLPAQSRF